MTESEDQQAKEAAAAEAHRRTLEQQEVTPASSEIAAAHPSTNSQVRHRQELESNRKAADASVQDAKDSLIKAGTTILTHSLTHSLTH